MDQPKMLKNFIWNTVGQLTYMVCQFLCGIFVVSLAGNQVSGVYNTALTATNIFLSIASYGMYSFQVSDLAAKYSDSSYIRSRVWTCAVASMLCGGFVVVNAVTGENPYSAQQSVCVLLFLGYRMVESFTDIFNAIDQRCGRLDIVGKTYAMRGIVMFISFIAALRLTQNIVLTLALMLAASLAVFFAYSLPQARRLYIPAAVQRTQVAAVLWECAPLAVYSFLNTTTASIPKLMLGRLLGETALGIYGPVTQPVLLLQVGATYLFNPFITVFAGSYARRNAKGFWHAVLGVQGVVLALLPVGLFVAAFLGRWGLATFVSAELADYQYLLAPMVVSAILTALVLFYSMVLTVMRCMKGLIAANACAIVVSALASAPCIARWALQGTTYAAIAAQAVQLVLLDGTAFVMARRHFSAAGPLPKPEDPFDGLPS